MPCKVGSTRHLFQTSPLYLNEMMYNKHLGNRDTRDKCTVLCLIIFSTFNILSHPWLTTFPGFSGHEKWLVFIYTNYFSVSPFFFFLEDNCFTTLCWFLTYISMNQPQVYTCPHPPHPSRLSQSTGLSSLCHTAMFFLLLLFVSIISKLIVVGV